jgi:VCBS repeat-containing protein
VGRAARRRFRPAALLLAILVSTILASPVAAARLWTIAAAPSTISASTDSNVDLTVQATGGNGGGDEIGCVMVTVPAGFTVVGSSIVSVPAGTWTTTTQPSGGATLVRFQASGSRLVGGGSSGQTAVFRITVNAATQGNYTWAADAKNQQNCGAGDFPNVNLAITVGTPVNHPPTAVADSGYSVHHRSTLNVGAPGVLGNDSDPDGDPITAVLDGTTANGTLTLHANGSFTFTPTPGFVGTDGFTYHAFDGTDASSSASVSIDVTDATPVANADAFDVEKNNPKVVAAGAGVLFNDSDPDGDPLTAALLANGSHGSASLAADGSFTYTPTSGYTGTDQFTYTVSDGALTATGTVTLTITNQAPVDDTYAASKSLILTVPAGTGVLANDSDPNGDALTVSLVSGPSHALLFSLSPDGSFSYTPILLYTGPDQFTYSVSDGLLTATATVTIGVGNNSPIAGDDSGTVVHDRDLIVGAPGVLANDTDPNGDTLTAVLVSGPGHGTLTLNADGSYLYRPAAGYVGTDQFTYRASDGTDTSGVATVSLTVTNSAPVAVGDSASVKKNVALTVPAPGVLGNDTDADGDALSVVVDVDVAHGTLSLASDGGWTYTPEPGYVGADAFTYRVSDGAATATATVSITVANTAPTAGSDAYNVWRNGVLSVTTPGVLANDADANGDPIVAALGTGPSHGSLVLQPDGSFTYAPFAGFIGTDGFTYRADDGDLTSALATVTITVANRAPVAVDDGYVVTHDRTLTVTAASGLLANDTDPDGDALSLGVTALPAHGTLSVAPDGGFTYAPAAGYVGPDTFSYAVSDNDKQASASVSITVGNQPPVAGNDAFSVTAGTTLTTSSGALLANDHDADGDSLAAALAVPPAHGTASVTSGGRLTYQPAAGFTGSDTLQYSVSDGITSDTGTVTVTVNAAPTPSPTPIVSPTPEETATPEPAATPAASPDPSDSPSPSPSATPTPSDGPSPSPSASPVPGPTQAPPANPGSGEPAFVIPGGSGSGGIDLDLGFAASSLGALGLLLWAVPGLALTVPGLLVVLIVIAQVTGGLAWLPVVRRNLGSRRRMAGARLR